MVNYIAWLSLFAGLFMRVAIPWLAKRQQDPENAKWDWVYVWPQLLSFGLVALLLPLTIQDLASVSDIPAQAAWILGWGAADIGRKTYKALANED
jgi:hypothetical protein